MNDRSCHSQAEKKSKQCPGKICRCSNSAFLHGVEWGRLIVHRTLKYWSITLQMEHCFGNNIKSQMGILSLIRKIYFNQKTLTKNIFLKFVYVFINAGIGWNFNILNVFCQITFPSCTLSDMDQWLSVEYKTMYILI